MSGRGWRCTPFITRLRRAVPLPRCAEEEKTLPGHFAALVVVEAVLAGAGFLLDDIDDAFAAFLDREHGGGTAHVGAHPAGADRKHRQPLAVEAGRERKIAAQTLH